MNILTIALISVIQIFYPEKPKAEPLFDGPDVLSPQEEKIIKKKIKDFRINHNYEIGIAIIKTRHGKNLNELSTEIANKWGLGTKKNNDGIFLLIVKNEVENSIIKNYKDKCGCANIAIGDYIEGDLPDIVVFNILKKDFLPSILEGDYNNAINNTIDGLTSILNKTEHAKEKYEIDKVEKSEDIPPWVISIIIIIFLLILLFGRNSSGGGGYSGGSGSYYSSSSSSNYSSGGDGSFGGGGASI